MLPVLGALRPWADPAITSIGRLPMHVPIARADRRSLDGEWSFALYPHPDEVPEAALTGPRPAATIEVPGNWTMQGTGDVPHYTNVQMPFSGPPPRLPQRLPTGVHRRSVKLPAAWRRRQVVLHVAGAESVHAVYVNGAFAGYGTDSRLPSEYDVTAQLRPGANEIAIVVLRYSAHSYVEDQDQWWMAGLHRSVHLEARPLVHVADVRCTTDFEPATGAGSVRVVAEVAFVAQPRAGWSVRTTLRGPTGRAVGAPLTAAVPHAFEQPYIFGGHIVVAEWAVPGAAAWSAETPHLYEVQCELIDAKGAVADTVTQRVGVRRVCVQGRRLLVNGQPIWIFGVNRHDHHPDRGTAVTEADMRCDLMAMRAHNITAVRTSHYPNDSAFYALCDELGMYVVDEANIESHAYNVSLCDDPRYRPAFLERGARMVQRDRNHPSVILWSLGNESGYGANHTALAAWVREADPTRPLHYEGAIFHGDQVPEGAVRRAGTMANWVDGGLAASDIVCPMYPPIDAIRRYGDTGLGTRPLIMCEYSHAMGNSNGSLADYWQAITTTPGLQGGFIWEWMDHGLRRQLPDGSTRLAYGGDFGDAPHDGNFVADGLMSSDGVPHPAMREVAWVYRPVTVSLKGGGDDRRLEVRNRQSFVGLEGLAATWELWREDRMVRRGRLRVPKVPPRGAVQVPVPGGMPKPHGDVHLTVRWHSTHDQWFAPAGHLVAWDQLVLRQARAPRMPALPSGRSATGDAAGGRCSLDELLVLSVELALWRAAIDNDGYKLLPDLSERLGVGGQALNRWVAAGVHRLPADELVQHEVRRLVGADGHAARYHHRVVVPEALADLPRVGVRFALPGRFRALRWCGFGPHENYPDRRASAMFGVWEGEPDRQPYLVPQEFGLRTGVRWLECADPAAGQTVRIEALGSPLHISATHHRAEDLFAAANEADLVARDELVVHLDVAHRGLGTASCGPDVLPQYRLPAGEYGFAYSITLLQP
ncbi:MAG: glycoside hydrolase family 2 TIM barrel-domain containing protein [Actinomycetota bacterium]|nr:glycoside hydrolase family 2 TIM barrel-domain containing protein [Actinomycetota bacterium]